MTMLPLSNGAVKCRKTLNLLRTAWWLWRVKVFGNVVEEGNKLHNGIHTQNTNHADLQAGRNDEGNQTTA
jgi:hypothetical protein